MGDLAGRELLDLWERVGDLSPQRRALAVAEAIGGEPLGDRPVGVRDAWLLGLCEALSGPVLEAVASCPGCAQETEFALDTPVLRKSAEQVVARGAIQVGDRHVAWRAPTGDDLVALEVLEDPESAAAELLARCVEGGAALTEGERALVAAAIVEADPLAEVLIELTCPGCDRPFSADVDIAEFAWRALREAGRRLLKEVDALARAYGWSEPEVLALPDRRRAAYLRLSAEGGRRPVSGVEGSAPGGSAGHDVLARLAARSVGRGAAARPRPRSRFEVAPGARWHGGMLAEGVDTASALDDDGDAAIGPATTTPLGLFRRRATGGPTDRNSEAGADADDWPTAGSARSAGAGSDGGAGGPTPDTAADHAPRAHDSGTGAVEPPARPPGPRPDATGASAAGTPLGRDRPDAETPFDRDHLGVVAARPAGRAQPTLASRVRAGDEPGPTGGAADRAPVVQIHIGRLDVRANLEAAPTAAPPAPAPAEPGLSLADYLDGKRGTR